MSNNNNNVTLPPIKHVFQGLFAVGNNAPKYRHQRSDSSEDYPSRDMNAAKSLQQLSSSMPCYYCPPQPAPCCNTDNTRFNTGHRRTVSASLDHPYNHHQNTGPSSQIMYPPPQQQSHHYRRQRAHTTSGYPPTMLFQPHVYHHDNKQTKETPPSPPATASNDATLHRYHCQHCRKSFSRPSSLRIHIYSHTGEKPFKCHHQGCGRSFSVHSNMRRHLRVHYYPPPPPPQKAATVQQQSMRLPIVPPSY